MAPPESVAKRAAGADQFEELVALEEGRATEDEGEAEAPRSRPLTEIAGDLDRLHQLLTALEEGLQRPGQSEQVEQELREELDRLTGPSHPSCENGKGSEVEAVVEVVTEKLDDRPPSPDGPVIASPCQPVQHQQSLELSL